MMNDPVLQADGVFYKGFHLKAVQATGYEAHLWELKPTSNNPISKIL